MSDRPPAKVSRAVLTLAMDNCIYVQMATNLARSFRWWHRNGDIRFYVATDRADIWPDNLDYVSIIEVEKGRYGRGFSPKLYLDELAPCEETLFLDADCLCVANLGPVFDKFHGRDVSVVGRLETEGRLFGDIAHRCKVAGVNWVPRFCGGLYYLRRGGVCKDVFRIARQFESRYDELGLGRLRGVPNEEPLIGLAMAIKGQSPILEDGSIKGEPMFFSARPEIDVFSGYARLFDSPSKAKPYLEWKIPAEARPAVVHFNCCFAERPPYTREALRLGKVMDKHWPVTLATTYAFVLCTMPFLLVDSLKKLLRPLYHYYFGVRPVKVSRRLQIS